MKVLFCFYTLGQARHFLELLRLLRERSDEVYVLSLHGKPRDNPPTYLKEFPQVQIVEWPSSTHSFWVRYADAFRMARNGAFFADTRFCETAELRRRVWSAIDPILMPASSGARWAQILLEGIEWAIPPRRDLMEIFRSIGPDIVLVSPLVNHLTGAQTDYVKVAHALGTPVALPVFSWDNLSTKGAIHCLPDRIFVWNQVQMDEAIALHGVEPSIISKHGAWRFDGYRAIRPSINYETFCANYGFDSRQRTILYLGSSELIAPQEGEFGSQWISALRSSNDSVVADANILVRPHPRNRKTWMKLISSNTFERVAFQISKLSFFDEQGLFDTINNCDACFAINTSGVLEASIQLKPVLTVLHPGTSQGQRGTLHYEYLVTSGGGLLYEAPSLKEHVRQLGKCLRRKRGSPDRRARKFSREFLDRPDGRIQCSESLLAAIEETSQIRKLPALRRNLFQVLIDLAVRGLVYGGLIPLRPLISAKVSAKVDAPSTRGISISLTDPLSLPLFRPLWRLIFSRIAIALKELLVSERAPSPFEAAVVHTLRRRLWQPSPSPLLPVFQKRLKRTSKTKCLGNEMGMARKLTLKLIECRAGSKYVLEHIQAFPIPRGIPKSREQCESSAPWGMEGNHGASLQPRLA